MKRKILLQFTNLTYFYYGLAAIKTIYGNDFDLDVLISNASKSDYEYIKKCLTDYEYINEKFFASDELITKVNHLTCGKGLIAQKKFDLYKKHKLFEVFDEMFENHRYDDVFYVHESRMFLISALKLYFSESVFSMYGDGFGIFLSASFDFCTKRKEIPHIINEITPDKAVGLLPCDVDDFFAKREIPLFVTNCNIMKDLLRSDTILKNAIKDFIKKNVEKYADKEKCLLIDGHFYENAYCTLESEINANIEAIKSNIPQKSCILIKSHPRSIGSKVKYYKDILKDDYVILEIPKELSRLPIEGMKPLLDECKYIISNSSSFVPLKYLWGVDAIDISRILAKYMPIYIYAFCNEVYKKIPSYTGNGLIYNKKWENWSTIERPVFIKGCKTFLHNVKSKFIG